MRQLEKKYKHSLVHPLVILWLGVILSAGTVLGNYQDEVILNRKGRKYIRERRWEKAIQTYEQLLQKHTSSLYCDDALFWIGFSLEQIPGRESDAYGNYQKVIDEYPQSPWADDATIHQISLAKRLVQGGDLERTRFLHQKTSAPDSRIRYQAALALGELKDPMALPVLEEMAQGEDIGLATMAMDALKGFSELMEETVAGRTYPSRSEEEITSDLSSAVLFDKLLRTEETWTDEQLYLNGLYHIVPDQDLEFFLSLQSDWDKKEWWRKVWAGLDPTPTTPENEALEEFKRRVITAYQEFGKEWSSEHFYYPPWDARGELTIKFGDPENKDTSEGPDWELWTYYRYRIAFMVSGHRSNRSGNGIYLSPVSQYLFRRNLGYKRTFYIREPQFRVSIPELEEVRRIKGFRMQSTSVSRSGSKMHVTLTYWIPSRNIHFRNGDGRYLGTYRYRWVLYDEDYHPVTSYDAVEELVRTDEESLKEGEIMGNIELTVAPGLYRLGLRIEDLQSKRLGIFKKRFTVRGKGEVEESGDTIQ